MTLNFLDYYNQELQYLREMGGEFARNFPKIASRLGLENFECADPFVERLLEGFSFLAARVQMKLDGQFQRFAQHLIEMVYPSYLAPTPSMAIVQFEPNWKHPRLPGGMLVPRQTPLLSQLDRRGTTRCEYRTAQDVTLWPLRLTEAKYSAYSGAFGGVSVDFARTPKAMLRLRFEMQGAATSSELSLDRLPLYLRGSDGLPVRLYEHLIRNVVGVLVTSTDRPCAWHVKLPATSVSPLGFTDEEALLPVSRRTFRGYRLLQEYFAFPEKYLFVQLAGLGEALGSRDAAAFDVVVLLDSHDIRLESVLDASHFTLYCTPAINLFPRRADRVAINDEQFEYQVIPDRTRPIDFEVYSVEEATGYRTGSTEIQHFTPFYFASSSGGEQKLSNAAYYQLRRQPRTLSALERQAGARSRYLGSEVFIALVDSADAPYAADLRQMGLSLLCTNRDLPMSMSVGVARTDFTFGAEIAANSARCISGPSEPRRALAEDKSAWRLLNHLSHNYLQLVDADEGSGRAANNVRALRELLALYCAPENEVGHRQIDGILSVSSRALTRRIPAPGPICFGRGLEITLTFDDVAFEGSGAFLLGAVLGEFLSSYASLNHFTETVVRTSARGEIMRWSAKAGPCEIL